jgi:hypothetical protein
MAVVSCRSGKAMSKSVRPLVEALVTTKAAMSDASDEARDGLQVLVQEILGVEGEHVVVAHST